MRYASYDTDFNEWVFVRLDNDGKPYIMEGTNTKITFDSYISVDDNTSLSDLSEGEHK